MTEYVPLVGTLFAHCLDCGAVVVDQGQHNQFHRELSTTHDDVITLWRNS